MEKEIYNSQVLEFFFDDPEGTYHIREIARQIKRHPNTVLKEVNLLAKEGLLIKRATRAVVEVRVNRDAELFTRLKRLFNLRRIYISGIIDAIDLHYGAPEAIVLFGSYSRGEDVVKSDVDIAIVTKKEQSMDVDKYEKVFKRNIQVHAIDLHKVGKGFLVNLINGIVLKGYLHL